MADIIYKINNKGTDYNMASAAYCTCATAAATVAKVANLQDSSSNTFSGGSIPTGVTIHVKFTYSNTASNPTLNVNGSGAKSIMRYGTTAVGTDAKTSWRAGAIVSFTYDGTNWVMNTGIDDNTTYTIPTVNNATLTLNVGGQAVSGNNAFTANDATNTTYNVPSATASAYGVIKVSSVNSSAVTVNSESTTTGRYYPVELNSDGKAIVNVPWTDTDTNTHNSHAIISGKKSDGTTDIKGSASSGDITLGDSGVTAGTYRSVTVNSKGIVVAGSSADTDTNSWRKVQLNGVDKLGTATTTNPLNIKAGSNMTITESNGTFTFSATDTNTDTNTSHSHDAGVGLVGSGSASTSGGTYTYKAKLRSETALTIDSAAATTTSGRVYPVAVDKSGYLAVNVPWTNTDSDTKNTAGSTDTSSKIFLIGATSQAANPQTYSHDTAYVGTDGHLYSNSSQVVNLSSEQTITGRKYMQNLGITGQLWDKEAYQGTAGQILSSTGDGVKWINNTSSDTKNTAGSTNSTSKLYLIGATSQAANPQTYSHSSVYATNGMLYAGGFVSGFCSLTDDSLNLNQGNASIYADGNDDLHLYSDGGTVYVNNLVADASISILDEPVATQAWVQNLLASKATLSYAVIRQFRNETTDSWGWKESPGASTVVTNAGNKSVTVNIAKPAHPNTSSKSNRYILEISTVGIEYTISATRMTYTLVETLAASKRYEISFTSPSTSSGVHKIVLSTPLMNLTINFKLASTTYLD